MHLQQSECQKKNPTEPTDGPGRPFVSLTQSGTITTTAFHLAVSLPAQSQLLHHAQLSRGNELAMGATSQYILDKTSAWGNSPVHDRARLDRRRRASDRYQSRNPGRLHPSLVIYSGRLSAGCTRSTVARKAGRELRGKASLAFLLRTFASGSGGRGDGGRCDGDRDRRRAMDRRVKYQRR
jgi:hypothetical protein